MKNNVMLVDGMALLFRGYFATAFRGNFMRNNQGIPTNGIQQFLRYFMNATNKFKPTHVIVCWDMGSETFRTELYSNYKANRDAPPEELAPQFELIKDVVASFDIPNIGLKNYEADDCIGTLATQYQEDHNVLIVTGDLDMLQLVDTNVNVAIMRKGIGNYEVFNEQNFYEKRGLYPNQIIDFKGLTGDSADNYPGVRGIGEKTALRLLKKYDTVDNLLKNIADLTPALKRNLENDTELLYLSQKLAKIKTDTPIEISLEDSVWNYSQDQVDSKLSELEIRSITTFI